jgi:hypothetical protein
LSLIFLSLKCERTGQNGAIDSAMKYRIRASTFFASCAEKVGD